VLERFDYKKIASSPSKKMSEQVDYVNQWIADWRQKVVNESMNLSQLEPQIQQFIQHQHQHNRKVVLVTSGRMNVPLEKNMVRYISNFSSGSRGAHSAQEFLSNEQYSVIYLHHSSALRPFDIHSSFSVKRNQIDVNDNGEIVVKASDFQTNFLKKHLQVYKIVKQDQRLLEVQYETLYEYLVLLSSISKMLNDLKHDAIIYSAAAVADFYIPYEEMHEHKIQSRDVPDSKLQISLEQTPKCLEALRFDWCPQAFIVSFKLESDVEIINQKVNDAITKYNVDVVLSNILSTYAHTIHIHYNDYSANRQPSSGKKVTVDTTKGEQLEPIIIPELIQAHQKFIDHHQARVV
jgi:phosphopantothenate-cysteine ligase